MLAAQAVKVRDDVLEGLFLRGIVDRQMTGHAGPFFLFARGCGGHVAHSFREWIITQSCEYLTFRTQKTLDFMQFSPLVSIIGKYTVRYNAYLNRVFIV